MPTAWRTTPGNALRGSKPLRPLGIELRPSSSAAQDRRSATCEVLLARHRSAAWGKRIAAEVYVAAVGGCGGWRSESRRVRPECGGHSGSRGGASHRGAGRAPPAHRREANRLPIEVLERRRVARRVSMMHSPHERATGSAAEARLKGYAGRTKLLRATAGPLPQSGRKKAVAHVRANRPVAGFICAISAASLIAATFAAPVGSRESRTPGERAPCGPGPQGAGRRSAGHRAPRDQTAGGLARIRCKCRPSRRQSLVKITWPPPAGPAGIPPLWPIADRRPEPWAGPRPLAPARPRRRAVPSVR